MCGDWWDEDPYSPGYNRFAHVPCGVGPGFATAESEALWTETLAYPYLTVIRFNVNPTAGGQPERASVCIRSHWPAARAEFPTSISDSGGVGNEEMAAIGIRMLKLSRRSLLRGSSNRRLGNGVVLQPGQKR